MYKNNQEEHDHSVKYPIDPAAYKIAAEIGSGANSVVYKALCETLGSEPVAIKSLDLERHVAAWGLESKKISESHPNILVEHCSFVVERRLWVVMPFMSAGSIASIISAGFPSGLPEPAIAVVLRHTLAAISHLHRQGYPHRDVKAGNILVDSVGSVKLAGSGTDDAAKPSYLKAPEASVDGYGTKADIWSFGVTAVELFHGRPPICHGDGSAKKKKNKKTISRAFKEMVGLYLKQDPAERPTAESLLNHSFFENYSEEGFEFLQGLPSLEDRCKVSKKDNEGVTMERIVTGWRFDEQEFELKPASTGDEVIVLDREKVVMGLNKMKENLERERKILGDMLRKVGAEEETREEFLQRTAKALRSELEAERRRNSKLQRENEFLRMEILSRDENKA